MTEVIKLNKKSSALLAAEKRIEEIEEANEELRGQIKFLEGQNSAIDIIDNIESKINQIVSKKLSSAYKDLNAAFMEREKEMRSDIAERTRDILKTKDLAVMAAESACEIAKGGALNVQAYAKEVKFLREDVESMKAKLGMK